MKTAVEDLVDLLWGPDMSTIATPTRVARTRSNLAAAFERLVRDGPSPVVPTHPPDGQCVVTGAPAPPPNGLSLGLDSACRSQHAEVVSTPSGQPVIRLSVEQQPYTSQYDILLFDMEQAAQLRDWLTKVLM